MAYVFGADIGGTTVKLGLFGSDENLIEKWEIPTRTENGGVQVVPDVAASILAKMKERGIAKEEVLGIGMGAPGAVDDDGYMSGGAVNLGWAPFNLKDAAEEATGGIPVIAANDANVAAYGEMWKGGGRGNSNVVAVTLGTGVGGGIIVGGRLLTGATGAGGEIGHIHIVDEETEVCGCGHCGCLEQYASATGVVRLARRRLAEDDKPSVLREGEVSAKTVFDAVKAGDAVAVEIAERFGYYLGKGLAAVANVVNPEIFVIGGGVSKAGEILLSFVEPNFQKYVFPPCRHARFSLAQLGNDAGIVGAAGMVFEKEKVNAG
ncbi:MAG: ROK family glucokinase [Lachnospiraceae bacterium]|nr:ROK family glucokinase [Lachnospiraceae bacterium]